MAGRIAYYGNIATQGLVLNLDAAIQGSYPKTGSTWFDISNNGNNGTLTNGPLYTGSNYGAIVFDGVDDFISGSDTPFRFSTTFTIDLYMYWDGLDKTNVSLLGKRNGSPYNQYSFFLNNGNPYTGGTGKSIAFFAREDAASSAKDTLLTYTFPSASIYNITATVNTTYQALYINGNLISSSTKNYTGDTFNIQGRDLLISTNRDNVGTGILPTFNNKIYTVKIYNRALSQLEVQQNFNALRGRYGI